LIASAAKQPGQQTTQAALMNQPGIGDAVRCQESCGSGNFHQFIVVELVGVLNRLNHVAISVAKSDQSAAKM
jgi:hypothetical protein